MERRRRSRYFFKLGHIVTGRCIGTLFSCGLVALIVGSVCYKNGQLIDESDGDEVQDPLTTAGIIFLAAGTVTLLQGMLLLAMSCKSCFVTPKTFTSTATTTEPSVDIGVASLDVETNLNDGFYVIEPRNSIESLSVNDVPPPYPGVSLALSSDSLPPPYPG